MKNNKLLLVCMVLLVMLTSSAFATDHIVISELGVDPSYESDTHDDGKEYIELYNPTDSAVDISGWHLKSYGLPSWDIVIPSAIIQSQGYYLIADMGDSEGAEWPLNWSTPDLSTNLILIQLNPYGLKLTDSQDTIIDAVGWGSILLHQDYFESDPLDFPVGGYFERKPGSQSPDCGNWIDTDNNYDDFLDNSFPNPQNSASTEEPCDTEVQCLQDSDCDDQLFCNGAEICVNNECQAGAQACDDQISCTDDTCDEENDQCTNAVNDGNCDDGAYCNGVEICDATLDCQQGTTIDCDDTNECTEDACDEQTDQCIYTDSQLGTICGLARDCPADRCNVFTAEFFPDDGHDTCDGNGNCQEYSCAIETSYCSDNDPNDGINSLECNAECDQDADCGQGFACSSTCECELSGEPYCGDSILNRPEEQCDDLDFGGIDCTTYGYDDGFLLCQSCIINTENCFSYSFDTDEDEIPDSEDNCPLISNPGQADADADNIGDACDDCVDDPENDIDNDDVCGDIDNCPTDYNPSQEDVDQDEIGDICDDDNDNDLIIDTEDNCPLISNPGQEDADQDQIGDICDTCPNDSENDIDQDTICGDIDNCPSISNPGQENVDGDQEGDACDNDTDNDGFDDDQDNCPSISNELQEDADQDQIGDACDTCPNDSDNDIDEDELCADVDNCPTDYNPDQGDLDEDDLGDACDNDSDNDGIEDDQDACPLDQDNDIDQDTICGEIDNCPDTPNTDQNDYDGDSMGDACDEDDDNDNVLDFADFCPNDPNNDADEDEVCADVDNCDETYNEDQSNLDSDLFGDVCDICPNDSENDVDVDEICGDLDYITGYSSSISSNIPCLEFLVNNQTDVINYEGKANVTIRDCNKNKTIAEFEFNFGQGSKINLLGTNLTIETNGTSSVVFSGVDLTAQNSTKTIYLDVVLGTDTLCIVDSEVSSISVQADCSNGVKLTCNGTSGDYTCEKIQNNTIYKVTGLRHSAIAEYTYTPSDDGDGGSGGSGGSGGGSSGGDATCTPYWKCTDWSICKPNGESTRTCNDLNECDGERPSEKRSCFYYTPTEKDESEETQPTIKQKEPEPEEDILVTTEQGLSLITGMIFENLSNVGDYLRSNPIIPTLAVILIAIMLVLIIFLATRTTKPKKRKKRK